jgi:hypothetical protein
LYGGWVWFFFVSFLCTVVGLAFLFVLSLYGGLVSFSFCTVVGFGFLFLVFFYFIYERFVCLFRLSIYIRWFDLSFCLLFTTLLNTSCTVV